MDLAIRFDYGRTVPWVTSSEKRGVRELRAVAGSDMVVLHTSAPLHGVDHSTMSDFTLRKGQTMSFTLTYSSSLEKVPDAISSRRALVETESYWKRWMKKSTYKGEYAEDVTRSLMTLKAMTYQPTGGIVAAATTSLPEQIGGVAQLGLPLLLACATPHSRCWSCCARDTTKRPAWRRWLVRAIAGAPDQVQTIYGIRGERDLVEWEADWLPGYERSKPVRIGNAAAGQFQLDVFGEVASALARMPEAEDDMRVPTRELQIALVNHLCEVWRQPDQGIWEVRGKRRHFTHSKVMAWVAVDRAIQYVESRKREANDSALERELATNIRRWKRVRSEIHREVCEKGFDRKLNSFVQSYGSKALDASCLRIALVGFLPASDPRIRGTVEAIEKGLMNGGFVQRYKTRATKDGLPGCEGEFLACSFWMVSNLWLLGRKRDAKDLFERLLALRNDVGLLSEEYDSVAKRMVGNFPQALSHITMTHAAFTLSGDWKPQYSDDGCG